ncbi:3'-5' exonuclease [Pseudoclavibacter chungangensis]|uniref:3'-5' exonuclease n=1 Tax=Pseudoclavibacter chungangensis TaxID=587635 RepID=A0A7J5BTX6_9MICO|nr:exonuclease domain-containing protein [Pseudoclavibacter chungangensis]KAB1657747.1 3'-5' exonuclease [Pseudoclavibacter chungangensis]NYJ66673.1 DNA polymerase-3 subunit epsilon [Pseudoclavibacter chungangensis]
MSWTDRVAVFDLETTGIDPATSRIVTAFIGLIDADGELERGTDWLADPGVEIPEQASAVHGVTTEIARAEGRPAAEVVAAVRAGIEWIATHGVPLVVFNAPYDLSLLAAECRRYDLAPVVVGEQVVDPLVIDRAVDRYRKGKRTLVDMAAVYGVELLDAHTAGDDAVAAGRVTQAIAAAHPDEVGALPLEELHRRQVEWHEAQAADFEDYMRRQRDPDFTADRGWPQRP